MEALGALGGETWFRLGDRDLAMHVERTRALRSGTSLTEFTAGTARRLGIAANILPMSDDRVETMVITEEGALAFQRYFVGLQCAPVVERLRVQQCRTRRGHKRGVSGAAKSGSRRRHHLPFESLSQRRPDPGAVGYSQRAGRKRPRRSLPFHL